MKKAMVVFSLIFSFLLGASASIAAESLWKVGRALVKEAPSGEKESVKLSLRNDGRATKEEVQILGRWTDKKDGGEVRGSELGEFKRLGRFTAEVGLTKTAILEVPLAPMGLSPQGKKHIELVIITGNDVTDSRVID